MPSTATPAPIEADAPHLAIAFACRFGLIVAGLVALVAARFLRHPRFGSIIVPLWNRINRTAGRIRRLMDRVAAGRPPKPRPPRPHRPRPAPAAQPIRFPTGFAWLVVAIPNEAACFGSQLEYLLAEPGIAELIAACPAAARILRPLAHMLGVRSPALPPLPRKPRAPRRRALAEPPQAAPPRPALPPLPPNHPCAVYRPSAQWDVPRRRRNKPA